MKFSPIKAIRVLAKTANQETSQGVDARMFLEWLAAMEKKARDEKPRLGWVAAKGKEALPQELDESAD